MLLFTITLGGLLLMMGHHSRRESLFYYFRLEDQVPENHLLRLIDRYVNFEFIRAKLKDSYSDAGRPSIDPELLLRMLLVGYLYGVTSERKLVEELRMHLAWRIFLERQIGIFGGYSSLERSIRSADNAASRFYWASLTRRINSWKRTSLRSGSYIGFTLRLVRELEWSAYAFSNQTNASSLLPMPMYAPRARSGPTC